MFFTNENPHYQLIYDIWSWHTKKHNNVDELFPRKVKEDDASITFLLLVVFFNIKSIPTRMNDYKLQVFMGKARNHKIKSLFFTFENSQY